MGLLRATLQQNLESHESRVLTGPGTVSPDRRAAAAAGVSAGGALGAYLAKVRDHAYQVTDEEVAALRAAGHSDDELFELTVSSALGAAMRRHDAALAAVAAAYDEESP